ncbi:transporter substrate-binding domain-containing protein [Alteromonas sp. SM 2104]|nr:transporter substrate-binding domain-containing protein [Alteromonas oceanisediminis]
MVIGTKVAPPFVMKNDTGELEGISIDLWAEMAENLGIDYRFEEAELTDLVDGLQDGRYDASIAAITVTSSREAVIDFTHPYYTTGLAIATTKSERGWGSALARFFSWEFFAALSGLCLVLLAVGFVLWLFERKKNHEQFGGSPAQGLGASFWWAAVTMTTVGYGDKAPTTLGGRIVGLVWMFAAIIIISGFTAAIATSLTVSQLSSSIQGTDDLYGAKVVTLENSASAKFLSAIKVKHQSTTDLSEALTRLQDQEIDAVVYDKPILRYLVNQQFGDDILILPGEIERQDYAIGLSTNHPLRGALNEELLKVIESDTWEEIVRRYLGEENQP